MNKKERRGARDRRLMQQPGLDSERRNDARRAEQERRGDLRVPIDLWMEEVRGDEVYFRRSCNLSEGGVLFEQSIPYPVGTEVQLRFTLPGSTGEVVTSGQVVSAAQSNDGLGMGLKFVSLSNSARDQISSYLDSLLKMRSQRR